jgi:hypothetical protein
VSHFGAARLRGADMDRVVRYLLVQGVDPKRDLIVD